MSGAPVRAHGYASPKPYAQSGVLPVPASIGMSAVDAAQRIGSLPLKPAPPSRNRTCATPRSLRARQAPHSPSG